MSLGECILQSLGAISYFSWELSLLLVSLLAYVGIKCKDGQRTSLLLGLLPLALGGLLSAWIVLGEISKIKLHPGMIDEGMTLHYLSQAIGVTVISVIYSMLIFLVVIVCNKRYNL